jgi:hypothetical protein
MGHVRIGTRAGGQLGYEKFLGIGEEPDDSRETINSFLTCQKGGSSGRLLGESLTLFAGGGLQNVTWSDFSCLHPF